ncbi:Hypothetical predicted protein [Mytilus galloprovincialis]|uniref:Uncharacterized protein n=1 Tax=Mytilus galloprovincialis TaxID=29158 RepID=A0A8B6GYH9_MYTGA|nr:Hypothetical predicted protein [Mytilus galloprovincialis]
MSDTGSDHDDLRPSKSKESTSNTELSTDGAVSLFSTVLTNALEQQKVNLIKHFENQFIQPVKSTGVSTPDFVFKREGHRIQYLFNTESQNSGFGENTDSVHSRQMILSKSVNCFVLPFDDGLLFRSMPHQRTHTMVALLWS